MSVFDAFQDCTKSVPSELLPHLLSNVVLTGGSSSFPGFDSRFYSEIQASSGQRIRMVHCPDPSFLVRGLQNFCNSTDFQKNVISKKIYEEFGSLSLISMMNI